MKIKLDANEIAAILINWAKQKYNTHNINADFKNNEAEIEIVMPTDQIANGGSEVTDFAIRKARERIIDGYQPSKTVDEQPDLSPHMLDTFTLPLA